MKVFISDLHIGDGFTYDDFAYREKSFDEIFCDFIDQIWVKYIRAKKNKIENKNFTLVLLGDVFDFFRTHSYADRFSSLLNTKPRNELKEALTGVLYDEEFEIDIAKNILCKARKTNKATFDKLNSLAHKKEVRVVYCWGNHDFPMTNPIIQNEFNTILSKEIDYKEYVYENGIYAEHGHHYDLFNKSVFLNNKIRVVIGDAIVKFLINCFAEKFKSELDGIQRSGDIDNIRPLSVISAWMEALPADKKVKGKMQDFWAKEIDILLETKFFKDWFKHTKLGRIGLLGDLLTGLAGKLKISDHLIDFASNASQIKKDKEDHYRDVARNILDNKLGKIKDPPKWIKDKKIKDIKYVLFGHTHSAKYEVFINKKRGESFYINTGTWRKIIEPELEEGRWAKDFYNRAEINYAILYEKGNNIQIELWDGTLI